MASGTDQRKPTLQAAVGAMIIAFSAILVRLAGVSPETAAFFRCAYALPVLALLATRCPAPDPKDRWLAWLAGWFFAGDLIFWHHAIAAVGAGLSTVLANLQVVVVGLVAWATLGERPEGQVLTAIPLALAGVVLISGVLERDAYGDEPLRGVLFGLATTVAYSGFLLALRQSGRRRSAPAASLLRATAGATVTIAAYGLSTRTLHLLPHWPAHGWLLVLALGPQVLGWLLITISLPRLPALRASTLLLIQSAAALIFSRLILAEMPSLLQVAGVVLIMIGVGLAGSRRTSAAPAGHTLAARRD